MIPLLHDRQRIPYHYSYYTVTPLPYITYETVHISQNPAIIEWLFSIEESRNIFV